MQYCLILALSQNPKLLFIDEITSVLDYKAREFFLNELTLFCQNGGTVVLTTNIINEVQQCSTDLVIIKSIEEVIWGEQVEILNRFVKLRLNSLTILTDELREKALYLGKDADHFHLILVERDKVKDLNLQQEQVLAHPNLHEVFSYLTQAQ
jgi:ABC-type multidrug transport system ATPase subunit